MAPIDTVIAAANAIACGVVSLAAAWAVIDPRVRDGVIIKLGLIALSIGTGAAAVLLGTGGPPQLIGRAALLVNLGGTAIAAGWYLRTRTGKRRRRHVTDWASLALDDTEAA